jgi:formylglycine-generating enzyme required for sulfatase activity/serine/threonine protein kinase
MTEEEAFLAALELADEAARSAYLEKVCGRDPEFRRQVEELLTAHFKTDLFLEEPLPQQMTASLLTPISDNTVSLHGSPEEDAVEEKKTDAPAEYLHVLQPPTRPDSLGRIGHYEVLQILGKGGFGIVLRAFDDVLHRVVALKVLTPALAATSPARKRFLREARSSAQVRHENVVQVYAVEEQPLPYLVMEFIPGETFQQRLDRTGPLEAAEIVRLGRQIAEGLAAAHATGLIHRDIKPGNLLLEEGPQPRVKITDFGLARAADDASRTQSGLLAGTPMYMAPEQARGEMLDVRADLFSLGSVLYALTTGRPPFRAATTFAVLKRVVEDTPRPIRELIPETPPWLCEIIGKLQAKKPEDRFQSARELADLLANCEVQLKKNPNLDGFHLPASKPGRSGKWKWLAAAALLVLVLGLGLTEITGVTHLLQQQRPTSGAPNQVAGEQVRREQPVPMATTADFTNALGMNFQRIPAGRFTMGTSPEEIAVCLKEAEGNPSSLRRLKDYIQAEAPAHEVEITQPFYMAATEVTVRQFRQFVEEEDYTVGDGQWRNASSDNQAVVWVSWDNAVDFCKWLSKKEGRTYRLPTEAEWEYGCRAGKPAGRYCHGDDKAMLESYAWYEENGRETHRVGKKKPNAWGLYDMHGNAWEWCQDAFDPDYYQKSPRQDPPGGDGRERVVRGGAYDTPALLCRCAMRSHNEPSQRYGEIGFRVLLVSPSPPRPAKEGSK